MSQDEEWAWKQAHGSGRPLWEPVRLVDFQGERYKALTRLHRELAELYDTLDDEALAMYAIITHLLSQGTIIVHTAEAETRRLATQRLPNPGGNRRKRLTAERSREIGLAVGAAWRTFTSDNFPLQETT